MFLIVVLISCRTVMAASSGIKMGWVILACCFSLSMFICSADNLAVGFQLCIFIFAIVQLLCCVGITFTICKIREVVDAQITTKEHVAVLSYNQATL